MPRRSNALPPVLRDAGVTPREADVLDALAERRSNAEIARLLSISVRTVESHVSSLLAKLRAEDRSGLGAIARGMVVGPASSGRLPLALLEHAERGTFVGRRNEIARLRTAWEQAAAGRARTVVLTGEAGIGKSRLVAECAVLADRAGGAVLLGRCDEEPLVDYQPVAEALTALWPRIPSAARRAARRRLTPELAPLLPAASGGGPSTSSAPPPPSDPQAARYRLFEDVTRLLAAASRDTPILLVVEDLQWADASTFKLLRHLALRADRARLLVVATVRVAAQLSGRVLELVQAIRRGVGCEVIALDGLTDDDSLALVRADDAVARALDDDGVRSLAARLHLETNGNPLFLTEVLRGLGEDPVAIRSGTVKVPPTVRDVIERGLARLDDAARDVLAAAAAVGRTFRTDLLADAAAVAPATVDEALDEAVRAGLLTEAADRPGQLTFTHALVRSVLEEATAPTRAVRLHRRIGEALEAEDPGAHVAELAHHFLLAATPADHLRGVNYAEAAARQSLATLAHERAAQLYRRALVAMDLAPRPDAERRCDLLLAHASAARRGGLHAEAVGAAGRAVEAARQLDDPVRLADAALERASAAPVWSLDPDLAALLEEALTRLDGAHPDRRARLMARLAQAEYYTSEHGRRRELSREAVAVARSADDSTLAAVLSARHVALWGPGDAEERLRVADEIVAVADRMGDAELALQGEAWRLVDLLELGDVAGADVAIATHARLARDLRQPSAVRDAALWAAMRALLDGRFEDAERESLRALALSRRVHDPAADLFREVQRCWLQLERDASAEDLRQLVDVYDDLADRHPHVPAWRAKVALLHARLGDRTAASAVFRELGGTRFDRLPRDAVWVGGLTYLAEVAAFLRDRDQAAVVYDALLPFADRFVVVDRALLCLGAVSRPLGLLAHVLGDDEAAVGHLTDAVARHDRVGARPLAARTRVDLAELLVRRGDGPAAWRALLDAAEPVASELGMARVVERIASLGA